MLQKVPNYMDCHGKTIYHLRHPYSASESLRAPSEALRCSAGLPESGNGHPELGTQLVGA